MQSDAMITRNDASFANPQSPMPEREIQGLIVVDSGTLRVTVDDR